MLVIQGYVYGDVGIGLTSRNDFGSCFPQPEVGEESSAGSRMYLTTQKEHPADSFISFHESRSFTLVKGLGRSIIKPTGHKSAYRWYIIEEVNKKPVQRDKLHIHAPLQRHA
jgi:hypothetical protein